MLNTYACEQQAVWRIRLLGIKNATEMQSTKRRNGICPGKDTVTRIGKMYQNHLPHTSGVTSRFLEIVIIQPQDWLETSHAIQALRESKVVVLKLSDLEPNQAQRAADFVTGGTYAIDGHTQWLGEQTFLCTPSGVLVSTHGEQ